MQLTPEDKETLRKGQAVYLENMIGRTGEEFSSFVKLDMNRYREQKDKLEYEAMMRNPETAYLVSNEEFLSRVF